MKTNRKIKYTAIVLLCIAIGFTLYAYSFDTVEPVCQQTAERKIYLLNYVTKTNLKGAVYQHNKGFTFKGDDCHRVYLLAPIFRLPEIVWDSKIDYRKNGCENIDNMDIYCEVRYSRSPDGSVEVWYNFMEDN